VNTCCKKPEITCDEVLFKATPAGTDDEPRPSVTTLRTCKKEAKDSADGTASIGGTFLGTTDPASAGGSAVNCFALKLDQKMGPATTKIPTIPGPPEALDNYGRPSPRPMQRVDGEFVVVDAAAKGGEDDLCVGFMCEDGGSFNDAEDNEWQEYLDISWNSVTGECYSCNPENAEMGEPSALSVSRDAETLEPVEGDGVYDCDCPDGYYLNARKKNGACIEFVKVGGECFPNFGEKSSGAYFPCKPDEAMCAHGHCVAIESVLWDCNSGAACDPDNLDECDLMDDCGICGGDGLSCLDCETCYQNFREEKTCTSTGLLPEVITPGETVACCTLSQYEEDIERNELRAAKDELGQMKYKMNSPKTADEADEGLAGVLRLEGSCNGDGETVCNPKAEEPCDCQGGSIDAIEAKSTTLEEEFAAAVAATAESTGCDPKCWKKTINDCHRPSLCLDGYAEECKDSFISAGSCGTMDDTATKQGEIEAQIAEHEGKITTGKEEMVAQGAAIQESVGNLDAPQGFWNPNLKATEEDMAKMVGDVPWPTAYQTYQDVVQSVKASEQAIVQLKLDKHNLIQKRDRTLQMGVAWKCFGCFAELYASSCPK